MGNTQERKLKSSDEIFTEVLRDAIDKEFHNIASNIINKKIKEAEEEIRKTLEFQAETIISKVIKTVGVVQGYDVESCRHYVKATYKI